MEWCFSGKKFLLKKKGELVGKLTILRFNK